MRSALRPVWLAAALLLSFGLGAATASGLPIAKKTIAFTNKSVDIAIEYPQTGNKAIDAVLLAYARKTAADFKTFGPDLAHGDHQYTQQITYDVERNDGQMFAVVFTDYEDTGGAHPNSDYKTFNFLLPDGAQVFLPEIVDGARGIARVSQLATAQLIRDIGTGADAASDKDTITGGAAPLADNFKDFVWLPGKLHIYFPPYQVASYAAGPQETTIPLAGLKDVIRPDWRAPAASFDCKKAASVIEHAICADAALARLDRLVAEAYQTSVHQVAYDPKEQEPLKQAQRDWIVKRNKACAGAAPGACLTKFYRDRLAVLTKSG